MALSLFFNQAISDVEKIKILQLELNKKGQSIPRISVADQFDLAKNAALKASSTLNFNEFNPSTEWQNLTFSTAQLLPLEAKTKYEFHFEIEALKDTSLEIQLRITSEKRSFTPEKTLSTKTYSVKKGMHQISFRSDVTLDEKQYAFVCLMKNELIKARISNERCSGIMTVQNRINKAVSNYGKQEPPKNVAIDSFEFWTPERRPNGKNLAFKMSPTLAIFEKENVINPEIRPNPTGETNVWIADKNDTNPSLQLTWEEEISIQKIKLFFDCDYDHALESTLMGHPEDEMPFVVSDYSIEDENGIVLKTVTYNYQAINNITFEINIKTISNIFIVGGPGL